jgi:hypothetical protein
MSPNVRSRAPARAASLRNIYAGQTALLLMAGLLIALAA